MTQSWLLSMYAVHTSIYTEFGDIYNEFGVTEI